MIALEPSYPEGNFRGNQLLGGSIGLSPLCHAQATRFARQNSGPASTTVSHGFAVEWYSSPPFGSQGPCKHSKPCPMDVGTGDPMQQISWIPGTIWDRLRGATHTQTPLEGVCGLGQCGAQPS
jgi:hypothetical protein